MRKFYLYKVTNTVNGKVYIGMTCRPKTRFKEHLGKNSTCTKLKHAIQKYGKENFEFTILCIGSEEYILDLEEKAIIAYDSIDNGYNLVLGNPKTGAMCLSDEMKAKISDGLNKYYSENIAWNHGIVLGRRKEYDPCFVTGFWFPHPQDAIEILGIDVKAFRRWKKNGTLGDVAHPRKDSISTVPVYVGGFWFDTVVRACDKLNQKKATLLKRISDGFVEQKSNKIYKTGDDNHMTGRTGFSHHRSVPVVINGEVFGSISEAASASGFTKKMIYTRLKNKVDGFEYYDPTKHNKEELNSG